jgi:ribonuclease VapC
MFLDASAIVGLLNQEEHVDTLKRKLDAATTPFFVSPMVMLEAVLALARSRSTGRPDAAKIADAQLVVAEFVEALGAREVMISADIGRKAVDTAARYGKAVGHKADLNFGDCFAYACAKAYRVPLLYRGDDFAQTDLA